MAEEDSSTRDGRLEDRVADRERRKLRARRRESPTAWFGLGMFGLVGWSVTIPTLVGIALGMWIDHAYPGRVSWTLTLMFAGLVLGCVNAWRWIEVERSDD